MAKSVRRGWFCGPVAQLDRAAVSSFKKRAPAPFTVVLNFEDHSNNLTWTLCLWHRASWNSASGHEIADHEIAEQKSEQKMQVLHMTDVVSRLKSNRTA
jgi:hypothetical protein